MLNFVLCKMTWYVNKDLIVVFTGGNTGHSSDSSSLMLSEESVTSSAGTQLSG